MQRLEAYIGEGPTQSTKDEQMNEVKVDVDDIIRNFKFDGIHEEEVTPLEDEEVGEEEKVVLQYEDVH